MEVAIVKIMDVRPAALVFEINGDWTWFFALSGKRRTGICFVSAKRDRETLDLKNLHREFMDAANGVSGRSVPALQIIYGIKRDAYINEYMLAEKAESLGVSADEAKKMNGNLVNLPWETAIKPGRE